MFALSRDGERFFLHQPDAGMVVPVLLDLKNRRIEVRAPSVVELEDDYAVYDDMHEVLDAVGEAQRLQVSFARKFSRELSSTFRDQLSTGTMKIGEVRRLVEGYLRRVGGEGAEPEMSVMPGYTGMAAQFARSFSPE